MDENGYMLTDTITPDGKYVNANGEKTNYIPGWYQDAGGWHYIMKTDIMQVLPGFRIQMEMVLYQHRNLHGNR